MLLFSLIIPVFNRPQEVEELLHSLTLQTARNFEVIIVEDGSTETCEKVVKDYQQLLNINYYFKKNEGRSLARNDGMARAKGDYFIIFDSDCIIPPHYIATVNEYLRLNAVGCFGGSDAAHPSFTPTQKAINYAMTSFLTTGGLRGKSKKITKFYPRSFNMGISRKVWERVGGFPNVPLAEDIEYSFKIEDAGFQLAYIDNAFVYHKRRTNFRHFFKQVHKFGIGRIDLYVKYPSTLKFTHFFPALFVLFCMLTAILTMFCTLFALPLLTYVVALWIESTIVYRSLKVGFLSVIATFVQMLGYGLGFIKAFVLRVMFKKKTFAKY